MARNADALPRSVQTNNAPARDAQTLAIQDAIDQEKRLVDQLRRRGDTRLDEAKLRAGLGDVDAAARDLAQQTRTATPADAKKVADAGDKLKQSNAKLFESILGDPAQIADAIAETNYALDDSLDRLQAAVRRGNRQDAADALHGTVVRKRKRKRKLTVFRFNVQRRCCG